VRQPDFQHHDGDDDRDHPVGERVHAVRLHRLTSFSQSGG
jgi:hypothetical protein